MSEPDAVPLPRDGEVFFDVRGEARSMRLSWYANSRVAVFSIWQGNRCTGTFRLPLADLDRMVRTLQAGPPSPPMPANPGYGPGYTTQQPYAEYAPPAYAEPYQAEPYQAEPYQAEPYQAEPYQAEPYQAEPYYGTAAPYYEPTQEYSPGETSAPYSYQPADYSSGRAHEPGHALDGTQGLVDYDPPNYSELPSDAPADRPRSHRRPSHGDDYGDPLGFPDDQEPMPETAMLSFPSVPARNGPGAYR